MASPKAAHEGQHFGQRRPPLSVTIKAILERYPDGQIFKELIQNADDADARTVKFFLDNRQHATSSLVKPEIARFQGPALLAYNDAQFADDDWEGIQNLQRSGKAEDPFKVGKFGIGFNSVYNITDFPSIISGSKLAYLEPQEKIWEGKSGRLFEITGISDLPDTFSPFEGICGFTASMGSYPGTLFRFPLRTTPSELSDNVYSFSQLHQLLEVLKEGAKFLLLFLRSVNNIEVHEKNERGTTLLFKVSIQERDMVHSKRMLFMNQLKALHATQSYSICKIISFLADFHVEVRDQSYPQSELNHWLVSTEVGSTDHEVLALASKRKTFPWVGTALELKDSPRATVSPGGRVFCFLPMPVEASSPYPVHINGTFGLNDDRRTLKWPGIERRKDPTAKWNTELVSKLLPSCYYHLMLSAKQHLQPQEFYSALPEVKLPKGSPWKGLRRPLFQLLLSQAVVWTERKEALQLEGTWIRPCDGVFIPQGEQLPSVVYDTLSCCNVQLVKLPPSFWSILSFCGMSVKEVNPKFTRAQLRLNPDSYTTTGYVGKVEILRYCLSDKKYIDLQGLQLLPLADQVNFAAFNKSNVCQNFQYLCTQRCPAFLLPNQEGILVDVLDDSDLHSSLTQVARSGKTQLKELTATEVAHLLPQSTPQEWRSQQVALLPHLKLPSDWFERFWNWVHNESLHPFKGQFIVPVNLAGMPSGSFQVVRLNQQSPVVYIPSAIACSPQLLSALSKLKMMYSKQEDFPYLYHKELKKFLSSFNTNCVLDAIYSTSGYHSQVGLTEEEASSMRAFLSTSLPDIDSKGRRLQVLHSLPIFTTMANSSSQLCSVSRAASNSIVRAAIREPDSFVLSASCIPPNLYIFSNTYPQTQLLHLMETRGLVSVQSNIDFLLKFLFPLIQSGQFPQGLLNGVMEEVLESFPVMHRQVSSAKVNQLLSALGNLPFLKTGSQGYCCCPKDLYDPSNSELMELYKGELVFPIAPFNKEKYLKQLRQCSLRQSVQPQEIINIINSIALPQSAHPQMAGGVVLSRAKAVLKYLAKCDSHQLQVCVSIPSKKESCTFSSVLQQLATCRSWLPVCSTPPENYPSCIEWKGRPYTAHFVSRSNCTVVLSTQTTSTLPLIVGSQVYTVETQLSGKTTKMLSADTASQVVHVVAHFKLLIDNYANVPNKAMSHIVNLVYKFLQLAKQNGFLTQFRPLKTFKKWIWLKKQHAFVSPASVATKRNPTFHHSLEPFLFILPDKLAGHSGLFADYGMTRQVTEAQIISVLERIKLSDSTQLNPGETWDIVMNIITWLTDNGNREVSIPLGSILYVPIQSLSPTPELAEANEVVYTDNDFLNSYLSSVETGESYTFVHSKVHPKLAHCLGLSPLSNILDITEDTFEDAGQYEPLTVRLKNILKDYKDGLTIIKELLQNADDAEATEVNICYDARTHDVNRKALFFPGMADSHGPALVVHNNAVFSGEDFDNITKLAGATKQSTPLKIGKFGIGFCSVYHITDIPSFVSRDTLCIFDPTLSHLKKEIKNPARPGKKVKFTSKFIAASKQLAPYKDLYGFKPGDLYKGTMFRFPFRTSASELSGTIYSEVVCNELVENIHKNSSKLLLFLRNVEKITFSRISQREETPTILLKVTKTSRNVGTSITSHTINSNDLTTKTCIKQQWLVASSVNTVKDKQATASAACQLDHSLTGQQPRRVEGEVFCFLPLALKTGLPVHISSNFAVMSNRRGIWTSDGESETSFEVKWNEELMSTVVPSAYHLLLSALQTMEEQGLLDSYVFYSLWPVEQKLEVHNPWKILVSNLYSQIQSSNLFHSTSTKQWLTVGESKFLKSGILSVSSSNPSTPQCVLEVVEQLQLPIVYLPSDYHTHLDLSCSTITEEEFVKLFFININTLSDTTVRNKVLCYMFEVYATELDGNSERKAYLSAKLKAHPSVPCIPDGVILRQCSRVVDPTASFAGLFDAEECILPIGEFTNKQLVHAALLNLGMLSTYAPWYILIERARNVVREYDMDKIKALTKIKLILDCVETTLINDPYKEGGSPLSVIPFLPVLPKPEGYLLSWHGKSQALHCGNELVLKGQTSNYSHIPGSQTIAGSQIAIVNDEPLRNGGCGFISSTAQRLLQIRPTPSVTEVLNHLKCLITMFKSQRGSPSMELVRWSDCICHQTYHFLNNTVSEEVCGVLTELQTYSCIWTGKFFISPKVVAVDWSMENGPYLYRIPPDLATKTNLLTVLGIKEKFTTKEIVQAMQRMKDDFQGVPVKEACKNVLQKMIHELYDRIDSRQLEDINNAVLPDTSYVMRQASELAFNDAPWCKLDEEHKFVHAVVTRDLALQLGVTPVRSKMLEKYASHSSFKGTEFGQREELTQRIKNILREYPFDVTVLKELLQNADDAKAKRMYVILDKRTHTEQGNLSENWSALQGPALLVWNDSTFSEKDLEGIQRLGLGSKRSESESIGQYGIGFNVVYHLTDCPSFITGGETLCIFDPHCRYVPGANSISPGRRFAVSTRFWDDFPGLRSTYLRDEHDKCPSELLSGSLFRFPLRYTNKHVESSEIVDHTDSSSSEPLTAKVMHRNIREWAPEMKQALLFLNHVTELQFLVIEENDNHITTEYQYQVHLDDSAQRSRELLHDQISTFTQPCGSEPCVQRYPLTITEIQPKVAREETEQWLIQQGIGDIGDNDEPPHWSYIERIKPRHGIAAPLITTGDDSPVTHRGGSTTGASIAGSAPSTSQEGSRIFFLGRVFCFLPLPIKCNLPVHVNGHFILDSSRRALWKATQPGHIDDRTKWNENLLNAIASSYANLLIHAHEYFILQQPTAKGKLKMYIGNYYDIFPQWDSINIPNPEGYWHKVAENVYRKLAILNGPILAVIQSCEAQQEEANPIQQMSLQSTTATSVTLSNVSKRPKYHVKWHRVNHTDKPSAQVHLFRVASRFKESKSQLKVIMQHLGMNITCAPLKIKNCFDYVEVNIPSTDPEVVFKYYTAFFHLSNDPCAIASTPFRTVNALKIFFLYILRECNHTVFTDIGCFEFPNEPFGYPLLLTADCKLRSFIKVIKSTYSDLFPQSQDHFLHPELLKLHLKHSYFISKDENNEHIVEDILAKALPQALRKSRVQNASQNIGREALTSIWSCFETDPVFKAQIISILRNWALLLTTDNRLFSCPSKECLLPVIDLGDEVHKSLCLALQSLKMPFLAPGIFTIANQFCPMLWDYQWILKNLYYLHREVDISSSLSEETLKTLIGYLKNIDFRNSPCRNHLYALPLFEDIDDNMTTLVGKTVHVWPDNVCSAGRRKWLKEEKVVFLKQTGHWSNLGNNLGIREISSEVVYMQYIFPVFIKLSEEERFRHLEHIRDHIYNISQASTQSRNDRISNPAKKFISALKTLPCIGVCGEELRCVNEFCDHRIDIFTTFPQTFHYLPKKFYKNVKEGEENEWMKFFCSLGLRQSITKKEYLQFCRQTESGMQHDNEKSSSVLLRYLLSSGSSAKCPEDWYQDSHFLSQVSQLRFVHTVKLQELEWIVSSCSSSGSGALALTTLRGAAVAEHKTLLWTVRPIVKLPYMATHNYIHVLHSLHVILTPSVDDVVANIINITHSKFSEVALLYNYPEECNMPKDGNSIIEVMLHNFIFLKNRCPTADQIKQLSNSHCIPVYAGPKAESAFRNNFVALMKPHCVLTTTDAEEYFPFLHKLPNDLNVVSELLENIGVSSHLELKHFRIVLETAFKDSDGLKLEPNTTEVVRRAIRGLHTMLKEKRRQTNPRKMSDAEISEELTPLYLPTVEGKLHLSTSLIYCDTSIYEHIKVDLSTDLCILSIQKPHYDFSEEKFCSNIPESIRPRKMSQCFIQKVSTTDIVEESEIATALQRSLSLPTLKKTLLLLTGQITKDDKLQEQFGPILSDILENFNIQCIKNLNASIELVIVSPHRVIGTAKVDHHFQEESDGKTVTLSLDSYFNLPIMALQPVVEYLLSRMKPLCSTPESESALSLLEKFFLMAMLGESSSDHGKILKKAGTDLSLDHEDTDFKFEADITPRLGKDIPESWHHRLDQNINNIFHSEEWVGYEVTDDHMIFAQIVCPVLPEEAATLSAVMMKYKIFIKQEDEEEGITVSALKLFKFLQGRNPPTVKSEAEAKAVDVYKGPEMEELRKENDLKDAKKELCQELRTIWKLPNEERKQAVKRLYLKWHPDKNTDNADFAEEIFKFLLRQINQLEGSLPLEDPDGDGPLTTGETTCGASHRTYIICWEVFFREWDHTAYHHMQSSRSELLYQQGYYGGEGEGGGGGGGYYGSGWWGAAGEGTVPHFFDCDGDLTRPSPDQREWQRWVRQARGDYNALCVLHEQMAYSPELACHVCFMSHQVAEKALKGGKYAVCGLGEKGLKTHSLTDHACALQAERPEVLQGLSGFTDSLEKYYLDTRYPNRIPPPQIPLDTHTASEADQAKCNAENILEMMENIVYI